MPTITQISRQNRADQGFRVDRGRGNALRRAEASAPAPAVHPKAETPVVQTIAALEPEAIRQKLKVAAYCRVSTLMESQEGSIASQRKHYRKQIEGNPDWELAGIYLEAGVSGTKAEIRPELQRLIADCKAGRVQLILTKSISRFARNTADCLDMVRTLTALGVEIWFEKEGIRTGTMESEFMLSIMACLAEDESRSISGNMKWGLRKRFQSSTYKMANAPYGYRREGTDLIIVPEEAEIVKGIFHAALSGWGSNAIADDLNGRNIPGPTGQGWLDGTVRGILRNPVYIGDMLYQKTYMDDSYHQRSNKGQLDQYYDEGHHEGIVSREVFDLAAANVRQRRHECGNYTEQENPEQAEHRKNRYAFSGRVYCAHCGGPMYRVPVGKYPVLRCGTKRKSADACPQPNELEDNLKNAFLTCLNKLACDSRYVPETDAERAILEAINTLPTFRHELMNRRSELRIGPLKHYNAELLRVEKKIQQIEDKQAALAKTGVNENIDALIHMTRELEDLEAKRKELMIQRAGFAREETHIRLLLELMGSMARKYRKGIVVRDRYGVYYGDYQPMVNEEEISPQPACYDVDEFFEWTRHDPPESLMDSKGKMVAFNNDLVIRHIDLITVQDRGYDIHFKAGITIHVN